MTRFSCIPLVFLLFMGSLVSASDVSDDKPDKVSLPLEELRAFAETYRQIKQAYVDKVDDKLLIEGAINGMLQSLDPYSGYLNKDDLLDLQSTSDGIYDGLGVEVIPHNNQVKIVNTLLDSPAERAGILIDDVITEIDHMRVDRLGAEKAIDAMRGKAGEGIHLRIARQGKEFDFNLVRERLEVKSVKVVEHMPGYWHIRLKNFQQDTGQELIQTLREKAGNDPVYGIVLDLRDNPGGVLRAAIDVADLMLNEGLIVSTIGRTDDSRQKFFANPGDELEQVNTVVLINKNSASASEIVAGALQDHQRATIIGDNSYGKGVVQSILPLQSESAIKLTTSRYYTPNGRSIHGKGIQPDIKLQEKQPADNGDMQLKNAMNLLVQQSKRSL